MVPVRKGIKFVHKSALLKDDFVHLCLWFRYNYTNMFPFDLSRVVYMQRCVVFQNHLHQTSKISRLLIFIIQDYTLHFTFCCTFSCREAKDRECIVFGATRYKLFYDGARDKILQLICDVVHIIPCFHFCAFVSFLNVD